MMKPRMKMSLAKLVIMKFSSIIILLNTVNITSSLSLTAIEVPKYAKVGDRVRLVCNFSLGDDQLYSVKWYKDNMEFYRYTPRDVPHKAQQFEVEGMRVEMEMSDAHRVELKEISLETAGTIMCEVSTEAPRFKTAEASSDLTVVQPPSSGPWLSPRPRPDQRFRPGDLLEVNCTSPPSRPQAKLRYFINGQMDDGSHSVEYRKTGPDGLTSPTLSLSTFLTREHFNSGVVRLSCQAVIYTVWDQSSLAVYPSQELGEKALQRILRGGSKVLRPGLLLIFVSLVFVLIR